MSTTTVTDSQIRDLLEEAARAGDSAQVDLCHAALRGNRKARRACEEVISAAARDAAESAAIDAEIGDGPDPVIATALSEFAPVLPRWDESCTFPDLLATHNADSSPR